MKNVLKMSAALLFFLWLVLLRRSESKADSPINGVVTYLMNPNLVIDLSSGVGISRESHSPLLRAFCSEPD